MSFGSPFLLDHKCVSVESTPDLLRLERLLRLLAAARVRVVNKRESKRSMIDEQIIIMRVVAKAFFLISSQRYLSG